MTDPRKTILVVDDASLVRLFYRKVLESAGFQIEEAMNGLEALEKLATSTVDLLIVDVNMPHMDGMTFLSTLRRKSLPEASIPALVTSTEAAEVDLHAARSAGANFYLAKPVDPERLRQVAALLCGTPR